MRDDSGIHYAFDSLWNDYYLFTYSRRRYLVTFVHEVS